MPFFIVLHLLSATVWVGGMFFAYMVLRPTAAAQLEPPQRLALWVGIFRRFFVWVWTAIIVLLGTGYWMIFGVYGGMGNTPLFVHLMQSSGIIMMVIFMHVYFAPYKRLKKAVIESDWQAGARQLGQIRMLVAINMSLGLLTILIGSGGRYY